MDQFSAHLDRGWDLVQRGDPQGAEQSARRALELDNQSPEAYNLLGYVSALQGDFDEAVEHYRQAIALDDTYLEAMLNAAEVCIHPMGEFDDALALCEQALDLAENDDETVDALLLCFDAHLGKGDLEAAKEVCRRFPKGPFENSSHTFLVGRAFFEIGEIQRAAELIEASIQTNTTNPDAYYYLGLIRDERGDVAGATEAFLKARELDLEFPPAPWSLSRDTFRVTIDRAMATLAPEYRAYIKPSEIYLADVPGVEAVVDGVDPRTAVLLDALPNESGTLTNARLFVYQNNVERLAGGITGVEREIAAAIEREVQALFTERPSQPPASAGRHSRPPTSH